MRVTRWTIAVLAGLWACLAAPPSSAAAAPSTYRFLEEDAEGAFDLSAAVRATGEGEARLCFGYRSPKDHYYLRVRPRELALVRVENGKARELAPPSKLSAPLGRTPTELVLKRRAEKLSLLCRGLLLQVVGDLDPGAGKVGVATSGGLQLEAPRLQPVEPPAFADDFMREPNETGPWEATVGWTTTTVGDTSKSANGFFYRGTGNPGRAVTGFEFWDDYVVHASFKAAQEEGTVGIGLYFQDPKNYLALTWSSLRGMQLVRVRHGSPHVLATKPAAWVPNQWYRLSVQVLDGSLTAMVDGRVCLQATDASFGRGKVALLVDGKEFYFDDVVVKPATYFHDPAPFTHRVRWANVGGVQLAGSTAWQDYTLRVRATPADRSGLGIVFGWRGPRDYYLLRWGAEGASAGRKQILRVNGAKSVVVADAAGGYRPGQTYTIETTFRPGYAAVSINGKRALETADPGLTHGAIGFKPLSRAVREVTVALYEEPTPPEEESTKEFTNSDAHPDMAEWANPAKAWIARQAATGERVHWRKGDYYGDVSVQIPVPVLNPNARLNAILAASGENPGTGYTFQVRRPAPDKLALQLLRPAATKPVAAAATAVPADKPVSLTLARQGSYLVADLEGKRILKFRDATPLDGSRLGIETTGDGVNLDLRTVQVKSRNVYDYTFHDAPTDWQPQYGVWEVTNRWSCSPGWSWFGGRSERLAVIWNKRRFTGDLVLEYYAAPKMDAVPEAYELRFRDLNATICGDGKRLNSGYSFIIGGWGNTK
ncbi:MAG: hypothetical protein GX774_15390, partial [Armatimonadetes bacterium]|nr:hypothetical protein [Armatimonadota bacterium]